MKARLSMLVEVPPIWLAHLSGLSATVTLELGVEVFLTLNAEVAWVGRVQTVGVYFV